MLLLATFFPDTEQLSQSSLVDFNIFSEFLKCSVDIADLLGIAYVLSRIPGKSHSKLISAAFGWAVAEVILSRGVMLWADARGAEFSWLYIQKCLESNIFLVRWIIFSLLIANGPIDQTHFACTVCE